MDASRFLCRGQETKPTHWCGALLGYMASAQESPGQAPHPGLQTGRGHPWPEADMGTDTGFTGAGERWASRSGGGGVLPDPRGHISLTRKDTLGIPGEGVM